MMETITTYLFPAAAAALLCAGWAAVQLLARRMKTKNHMDHAPGCGRCSCGGTDCEMQTEPPSHPDIGDQNPTV